MKNKVSGFLCVLLSSVLLSSQPLQASEIDPRYQDMDGSTGEYSKGNGSSYAPYSDDVLRVYFAPPMYSN